MRVDFMKWILVCVSLLALPLAAQDAAAAKNRRELMMKLSNDVTAARANATLDDAQRKQLDTAIEGLRATAPGKKGGARPDREQMRASMQSIRQLAQSNAFKEEDRKKVQDDLAAIREFQKERRQQQQKQ